MRKSLTTRDENRKISRCRDNSWWAQMVALTFLGAFLAAFAGASARAQTAEGATGAGEFPLERVFVRKVMVTGSTVFSSMELGEVTAPYANRELTAEDLEELRRALTLYYVDRGYVNSGAVIPDQTVVDGVVRMHVIEGELTDIKVEGNKWFRDSYIKDRIALDAGPPLNINALQKRLQLLQQDDRILLVNAELRPSIRPGESAMNVRIEEKSPVRLSFIVDNYQSPSVGVPRGLINAAIQNLTGLGDSLDFTVGKSEGLTPLIDARYSLPITSRDTFLSLQYKFEDFEIVEEPFEALDIETDVQRFAITVGHPFYRSLENEFSLALTGEYIHSKTTLLDESFSLSPGADDGKYSLAVIRFSQEWTSRSQKQAMAARSRFSLGIDALGATTNPSPIPSGQFFAWLGQFQWVRVLGDIGIQMIFRTDLQLAADSPFPVELISVGGRYSVRGYRENTMVRDNAVIVSLESRIPLIRDRSWADYLQLVPFYDFGYGWNTDLETPTLDSISSAGLGLRWGATLLRHPNDIKAQFEIYWGYPFRDVDYESTEHDLQDEGISFQFVLSAS